MMLISPLYKYIDYLSSAGLNKFKYLLIQQYKLKFMTDETTTFQNSSLSRIFFILSLIVLVFWSVGQIIDVYRYPAVGAIFEILWLFMLLMLFILPIIALVLLIKEKFSFKSLYLYTLIVTIINILLMIFIK